MSPAARSPDATFPDPVIHEFAAVSRQLLACDSRPELLAGAEAAALRADIADQIQAKEASILSFDIFDTFLLRNDKAEAARFLELSQLVRSRLAANGSVNADNIPSDLDLFLARRQGMEISYRTRKAVEGCREGHIADVVRIARRSLGLSEQVDALMLEAERDYEVANLCVNPVLLDIAAKFKADGGRVILVSDMYLGRSEIESILRLIDKRALELADAIFSSADTIVSKRSGKVFPFIQNKIDARPEDFFHIGDALEGDVFRPREAGWSALYFPVSRNEAARREESLRQLNDEMRAKGQDVSHWAKV